MPCKDATSQPFTILQVQVGRATICTLLGSKTSVHRPDCFRDLLKALHEFLLVNPEGYSHPRRVFAVMTKWNAEWIILPWLASKRTSSVFTSNSIFSLNGKQCGVCKCFRQYHKATSNHSSFRIFRTASNLPSISSMLFRAASASWEAAWFIGAEPWRRKRPFPKTIPFFFVKKGMQTKSLQNLTSCLIIWGTSCHIWYASLETHDNLHPQTSLLPVLPGHVLQPLGAGQQLWDLDSDVPIPHEAVPVLSCIPPETPGKKRTKTKRQGTAATHWGNFQGTWVFFQGVYIINETCGILVASQSANKFLQLCVLYNMHFTHCTSSICAAGPWEASCFSFTKLSQAKAEIIWYNHWNLSWGNKEKSTRMSMLSAGDVWVDAVADWLSFTMELKIDRYLQRLHIQEHQLHQLPWFVKWEWFMYPLKTTCFSIPVPILLPLTGIPTTSMCSPFRLVPVLHARSVFRLPCQFLKCFRSTPKQWNLEKDRRHRDWLHAMPLKKPGHPSI